MRLTQSGTVFEVKQPNFDVFVGANECPSLVPNLGLFLDIYGSSETVDPDFEPKLRALKFDKTFKGGVNICFKSWGGSFQIERTILQHPAVGGKPLTLSTVEPVAIPQF